MKKELQKLKQNTGSVILTAKSCKKVIDCNQREIGATLIKCCLLVGKDLPNDDEKVVLINYLKANIKVFSLQEMELAFQQYVNKIFGQGDEKGNGKIIGRFCASYIMDVMAAYKKWRNRELTQVKQIEAPMEDIIEETPQKQKESFEFIGSWVETHKKLPVGANWSWAFKHAYRTKLITMSQLEIKQWRDKVDLIIVKESKEVDNRAQFLIESRRPEAFKRKCEEEYIKEYFKLMNGL